MRSFSAHVSVLAIAVGLLAAAAEGCNDEPPVERRLCERFDGCNFFIAGIDVNDCTDIMTMCTDGLVSSEHRDWTRAAEDALGNDNCLNFLEAYAEVDVCWIDEEAEVGDPTDGVPSDCSGGDSFECSAEHEISGCFEGESFVLDCADVCGEDGLASGGCGFSSDKGHDACFCDDEGGTATTEDTWGTTTDDTAPAPTDGTTTDDTTTATSGPVPPETGSSDEGGSTTAPGGESSDGSASGPVPP